MNTRRIGFDIGGIIIDRVNDGTDTSFFGDNYLATTAVPGAFATIKDSEGVFGDERYLVSKCGARVQARTTEWLTHHNFHTYTSLPPEKVHFTPTRIGKKAIAEMLGLTDFVDDRLEVLGHLVGTVEHLYLLNSQEHEVARHAAILPHVIIVNDMHDLSERLATS